MVKGTIWYRPTGGPLRVHTAFCDWRSGFWSLFADSNVTDVHASHYPWIRGRFHNFFLRRFLIHRNGLKEAIFHSGTGCLADDR